MRIKPCLWPGLLAVPVIGMPAEACADMADIASGRLAAEYWAGITLDNGRLDLSRLSVKPEIEFDFDNRWSAEFSARLEIAAEDTGLGTVETYSDAARPILRSEDARLEIDRATVMFRTRGFRATLGKQVTPWGVLDGVRVTDRFDAIRLRDFVLTDIRPDRLSRWGANLGITLADWNVEVAAAFDPTVNQRAAPGDLFDPTAPRFRGGIAADADIPLVIVPERDRYLEDATYGARLSRNLGAVSFSVLAFSGPETDPVLSSLITPGGDFAVALDHPRRTLVGGTLDFSAGPTVWRLEAAHIPDQPVNVLNDEPLDWERRPRTLVGVGLDWNAPFDIFMNGQIAVDHIDPGTETLVRPETEVIGTLRFQRSFANETWKAKVELIGSLSDGDGAVRPSLDYQVNDQVTLSLGADVLYGARDETFGQFRDRSRIWLRVSISQ